MAHLHQGVQPLDFHELHLPTVQVCAVLSRRRGPDCSPRGRVEIMGSQTCRIAGESQSVLTVIDPIIFTRATPLPGAEHGATMVCGSAGAYLQTMQQRLRVRLHVLRAGWPRVPHVQEALELHQCLPRLVHTPAPRRRRRRRRRHDEFGPSSGRTECAAPSHPAIRERNRG
eukprot:SAG25_NODE_160_length_13390_cov_9.002708_11_plen_171_part_00